MKVKNLFITFGLSLALGVVAAVGAGQKAPQKVEAYDKDTVYYCLTGVFNGVEHWTDYIDAPSDGKNAAVLLNQSLTAGDTFKFKVKKYKESRISLCTKVKLKTKILIMKL